MSRIAVAFAVSFTLGHAATAAPQTIPEIARSKPANPIVRGVLGDIPPTPIEELARGADLVVEGTLVKAKSCLTADEWNILTDYHFADIRVIATRSSACGRVGHSRSLRDFGILNRDESGPCILGGEVWISIQFQLPASSWELGAGSWKLF